MDALTNGVLLNWSFDGGVFEKPQLLKAEEKKRLLLQSKWEEAMDVQDRSFVILKAHEEIIQIIELLECGY